MIVNGIILENKHDYTTKDKSFQSVGRNTGNLLFREALLKELSLLQMSYEQYNSMGDVLEKLPIITTDLIWINENSNFDYLYRRVSDNPYVKFIPISVGLQNKSVESDFKLNDSVLRTLSAIQERAIIGVRGYYTADILEKNGIKNIEVIGCPSMFRMMDESFQIKKKNTKILNVSTNFKTLYGCLTQKEKHFLSYCATKKYSFVEQTDFDFSIDNTKDERYFQYVNSWMVKNKNIFFDVSEWERYSRNFDFAMGARFHGNVISLWQGIPALFISIDSRTKELIDYFDLPSIGIDEFDNSKPIEYYFELADYTLFNKNYEVKYRKFKDFLYRNEVFSNDSIGN